MVAREVMAKGIVEKVGMKGSFLKQELSEKEVLKLVGDVLDHQAGIEFILGVLTSEKYGCLSSIQDIEAVGHRVAHGGERFTDSAFIDDIVKKDIEKCIELAPLHNPANLKGILAMESLSNGIQQVAVFDTAFHQSMPAHAYMYAIPYSLYEHHKIRRYGFHGTSHRFVAKETCEHLGVDISTQKIISCHLGNGASVAAIDSGKSVDTSMGLTPVEGLIMGTRSGDLDLGVFTYIMDKEEIGLKSANALINKHSGVLGITNISSDMREIEEAANGGDKKSRLALNMYDYRIKKYIGAYSAAMGGLDILIFTGGIGENADTTRRGVCKNMEFLGIELDESKNTGLRGEVMVISNNDARVKVIVMPTNEELVIAEDTEKIISKL